MGSFSHRDVNIINIIFKPLTTSLCVNLHRFCTKLCNPSQIPMSTPAPIFPVLAHDYNSTLVQHACIYELIPPDTLSSPPSSTPDVPKKKHALVFIGGLGDGPHTVPVIRAVAGLMGEQLPEWSVFEVRLNSSFGQWGFSSLRADVVEIGEVVSYLRRQLGRSKVVLMGHSTGCQVGCSSCSSVAGQVGWC